MPQNFDEPSLVEYHWRDDGKFGFNYSRPIEPRPPQVYRPDEWWQERAAAVTRWVQQQEEFDIELTGILGVGKTQIEGKPGQVTLNSAKTGLITAATPEELLEKATGWQAPIMHLAYWVQAKPATQNAQANKDEQNRLKQLIEDGWTVDFSYNDKQILPNKLLLKQALADDKENRITMVIQNR